MMVRVRRGSMQSAMELRHRIAQAMRGYLNDLDFLASMEAYTFLRFLFLYDPVAARKLPRELRKRAAEPQIDRTNRALLATFGRDLDGLETLWRAFVLEITQS